MAEQLLDVISEVNPTTQEPYLGTCTVLLGDGSARLELHKGRAQVPAAVAGLIRHPHLRVLGAPVTPEPTPEPSPEPEPAAPSDHLERNGEKRPVTAEDIEAAREFLAEQGLEVPDPDDTPEPEDDAPELKPGFEASTTEGQPRCRAAKVDGSQCANAAVEGHACAIGKHKAQVNA